MEKLLQWSVAQNDPETAGQVAAPTNEQLAQLFGGAGPDDASLMSEQVKIIQNKEIDDLEIKLTAFENYEMLIENLDNANNIENLKHWEFLINELDSCNEEFKNFAASIIAIAVQNNDVSQKHFLKYSDLGFPKLIKLSKEEKNIKAIFALSNLIRNNNEALQHFEKHDGWEVLKIEEQNDKLNLKLFSLLNSLLTLDDDEKILQKIQDHKLINKILNSINKDSDINLVERSLNLITSLINHNYKFNKEEVLKIKEIVELIETHFKDVIDVESYQTLKSVSSSS